MTNIDKDISNTLTEDTQKIIPGREKVLTLQKAVGILKQSSKQLMKFE